MWSRGLQGSVDMTFKGLEQRAAPVAGNEPLPWVVFVTGEATGHLGICWFPRSLSEVAIWTNQAERLDYGGIPRSHVLPKIRDTLLPVHSRFKVDGAV